MYVHVCVAGYIEQADIAGELRVSRAIVSRIGFAWVCARTWARVNYFARVAARMRH